MRRFTVLCFLSVFMCVIFAPRAWADVAIDETNFPDENFRKYVSEYCDPDEDGSLSGGDIAAVKDITVGGGISNLKGIEYFTALTTLNCENNQLRELDVSNNTALEYLYCDKNQLTALNVSKNTALKELKCYSNQLTELDVSSSTALEKLECNSNQLTALDVSNNTKLTYLSCHSNQLTKLDVSNTALEELLCNSNQLTALDVSNNSNLSNLECNSNQLTALDVSNNTTLMYLSCHDNKLTALDVSSSTALEYLECYSNQLTALDVSKNANLTYLSCHSNQLTELDVSNNKVLEELYCHDNKLTALDVSNNTKLTYLSCHSNQLTKLDVSNNEALQTLYCYSNQLTALDVSSSTALKDLNCYSNQLTALDVSKNTALEQLYCSSNQLTKLDVSNNSALKDLYCYNNQLTALNVSSSTALKDLQCYRNQLTALNVSNNANLTYLYCHYNQLTALDVSKNTALQQLYCSNNQLTALDVSNNSALQTLYCSSNQLTALDVSKNSNLSNLECNGQNISGSNIIYTGDTSSPYKIDFSGYISTGNFTKISDFTAKDSNDAEITTTYANGVAQFASLPSTVTYNYATGKTAMDVTMSDFSLAVEINKTIFPDENFRAYVSGNLDTNKDGYLSEKEMTAATFLDVSGQRISSLKGIELFTGLKTLYCNDNQLTGLDVSNNTALTRLNCNNNKIATLDVSNNTALTYLNCGKNQMTSLDVSNNKALTYLNCANNQLAGLDISNCTSLAPDYLTADSNIIITHGTRDGLPSFTDHSLILSGQLGLDFYANVPASTNTEGAYTDFTVNDKTGSPEMFSNADKVGDDYRFTYYINSVQMADTITAKFCYSDDTKNMAAVQDCRVTDYLDAIISSTDLSAKSPDLVALAEAIKDYGHYVQIPLSRYNSWDIGTDHAEIECVNKNIDSDSADIKAKLEAYALSKDIEGSGIEKLTYDLELDSEITLNIYLTPGNDAGNVSAYITDDYGDFDGKTNMAVYDPSENAYVVTIGGISAHKLGRVYTVSITTGKGSGFTVKMSALSYANGVMQAENDGENIDDDIKRAVISLYKYYNATMKYRASNSTE